MSPKKERLSREEADRLQWEKTHQKILQAAADLFSTMDYHRTTTQQVAERAGVAKGTVFSHFKDKETLVLATIIYILESQMREFFEHQFQSEEEAMRYVVNYTFDLAENSPTLLQLIIQVFSDMIDGCKEIEDEKKQMYDELFKILDSFIEEGAKLFQTLGYSDPLTAARFFAAALDGLGLHAYTYKSVWGAEDKQRLVDFIVKLFLGGIN